MALIEWKDRMSVGVEALDNDHRKMVDLLNQLHDLMRHGRTDVSVRQIVHELVRYTDYHFDVEERLMRMVRYPQYEEHRQLHAELKERILKFEKKLESYSDTEVVILPLFDFVSDWLMRHILREDMKLKTFLTRTTPKSEAEAK